MNSKLLLALFLGASAGLTAQNVNTQGPQAMRTKKNNFVHQATAPVASSFSNRVEIWSNDLSVAADWVISNQSGNTDNWVIGTNGPSGGFAIGDILSTSAANGYALFDSDLLCSGNQKADLTMANSVNCSAFPLVVLEFQQNYRRFNDSTFVFVSNDGGTVWTKYTVNGALGNNDSSNNPETVKVNITPTAGGQANVKVRFEFWSPTGSFAAPGCGYAWMVDDVKLVTPPDFELLMTTLYHGDPVADWEYGTYPLSQVAAINVVAIVRNEGAIAQAATVNYAITRGATAVNSGVSPVFTIQPFTSDTIIIATGYTPDAVGNYTVAADITSPNTDIDPSNNTGTSDFAVSDFVYSGLTSLTGTVAYTYSGTAAPFEPSKIAHRYAIINDVSVKAIDIAVSSASTDDTDLIIELFDDADLTAPLAVGDFRITATHPTTAQYFTILIDQQSLVAGGLYVASMGSEATDKRFLFYGVAGDDDNATLVNVPDDNGVLTWFLSDLTAGVNLNFDPSVGIADVNAPAVNMDVYPNPANNQISWKVKSQEASSVTVSLVDINGKVVFNKSISGKVVSYQDTLSIAEFANGVYTLQVKTNNGTTSQKVVIAH